MTFLFKPKTSTKKLFTFLLVALFVASGFLIALPKVEGQSWTDITLPYTITVSGNYRITAPYTGSSKALAVNAPDVVIDGQNMAIIGTGGNTGLDFETENINAYNLNLSHFLKAVYMSAYPTGNYNITNSVFSDNNKGIYADTFENFTVSNCTFKDSTSIGFYASYVSDFAISNCTFENNGGYGFYGEYSNDFTFSDNNMTGESWAWFGDHLANFTFSDCNIANNYNGFYTVETDDFLVSNCTFFQNSDITFEGGIEIDNSNGTITNNTLTNNYDAFIFGVYTDENNTLNIFNNTLQNNDYTTYFQYQITPPLPTDHAQINFYNNLVNDSNYVDPVCFSGVNPPLESTASIPVGVFYLNTTRQAGDRVYGNGIEIGGNFWANSTNNLGYSQTGTDANHDGFIDTPFDFFGNATIYDYLPLSLGYEAPEPSPTSTPTPTPTPTATPSGGISLNINLIEILLTVLFMFFTALAFFTKEPFLFGLAAFFSIIFGTYLVITYLSDASSWAYTIIGLGLFCFGIFMLVYALVTGTKNKGGRK